MRKGTVIGAITTIILIVVLIEIMLNSQISIYPGTLFQYDFFSNERFEVATNVSLRDVFIHEKSELNLVGYAIAVLVNLVVPMLIGALVAKSINTKSSPIKLSRSNLRS